MSDRDYGGVAVAAPIVLAAGSSRDKLKEITDRLEQGIKELFESEKYESYLKTLSKFHNYSFNNCLLIAMQKPDATHVAGFTAWRDNFKRYVMKDQRGIKIIAPTPYKLASEQERIDPISGRPVIGADGKVVTDTKEVTKLTFKVVTVFDVSQTEGEPLPEIGLEELTGSVDRYRDFLNALTKSSPVPIEFEDITSGAKGYFDQTEQRIAINVGMSELQTLKTAIHELVHARLHNIDKNAPKDAARPTRDTREVEAESVAYTVCQHYGLDTSDYSFGYIASWSGDKELNTLKTSLDTIRTEADAIIRGTDTHMAELQKGRAVDPQPKHGNQCEPTTPKDAPDPGVLSEGVCVNPLMGAKSGDTFTIYQLKRDSSTADLRFRSLKDIEAAGLAPHAENYTKVYTAPLAEGTTLERIFCTFNIERPDDFTGHSLSVSDVVELDKGGEKTAYFVDSQGFKELPGFMGQTCISPLEAAEVPSAQDPNMIGDAHGKSSTLAGLEAKARGGEPVSLADLARAIKSERKTAQEVPSEDRRPSVREQLAAGRQQLARERAATQQKTVTKTQGLEV
jgi:hypothetical protein